MIEILPNWHPIFVHFTVALFSVAVVLLVISPWLKGALRDQWLNVALWCLWFGAGITVLTGLSGLYAYNTVNHDTPSHLAMTEHRNWALPTIGLFLVLAVWSYMRKRHHRGISTGLIVLAIVAGGLLASTAWHGGELVYRYGLGVLSLPKAEGAGHSHSHADGHEHESHGEEHAHPAPANVVAPGQSEMDMSGMSLQPEHDAHPSDGHVHDDGHQH